MSKISIERRVLQALADSAGDGWAVDIARRLLAPRPVKRHVKAARARKAAVKATKRQHTSEVYAAVERRAGGRCEVCWNRFTLTNPPELDHARGRIRVKESVESCWMLCRLCHRDKTDNRPSHASWLQTFLAHSRRHYYDGPAQRDARDLLDSLTIQGRAG